VVTITHEQPAVASEGCVRIGAGGPSLRIRLPRHVVGAEGSDALEWRARTTADAGDVETEYVSGPLRAVVQHDLSESAWRLRASLTTTSDDPVSVSSVLLEVDPADGRAWVWGARAAGLVVLVTAGGELWGFSLRRGTLTLDRGEVVWLDTGTTIEPGRRHVLELVGRRCRGWGEVASLLPAWLPVMAVRGDEPVDLALPDAGVVAAGCTILEGTDGTEIRGDGIQHASVRGGFGEVDLELAFALALVDAVDGAAREVARLVREEPDTVLPADTTTPAGRSRVLERTARRLVVLQAARSLEAADIAGGWLLAGVTDLLETGGTAGPFTVAALAGEAQRRDDPEVLAALAAALTGVEAEAGMVLALTRVWAVLWGLGQDPEPVRQALARVLAQPVRTGLEAVERALVTGDGAATAELMAVLGAGLPGTPIPVPQPWEAAYAVALTSLATGDDAAGPPLVQAAEMVARRLTAAHPGDPDVLAWLLLGER